ncbi:MAG: choice-of-anchor J domain-containing protein [Muribaculaceae bacterium]|nr:choice-of-anchor J domain-containing protein [Muribaculaceae bacterium]
MKKLKSYVGWLLMAMVGITSLSGCQDDFDAPGINVPQATLTPNTTIAQLKADYWNSADNYIDQVKLTAASEHVIISGRVISSDASGNIYKSLVIQDATGALALSINANSLYVQYRIGQEVVIDVTDMYIGKYSTLQQLGYPDYSASYGWQATFMPLEFFKEHAQLNGLPEPSKIDTLELSIGDLGNGSDGLMKYQSQLVRFNNVYFEEGGQVSFCTAHKVNTNRTLKDDAGNSIIVRTSGYANFWATRVPAEHGDVVGILSTYKSGGNTVWQLLLRSTDDLLNFGDPTLPKGTETNPYDVAEAIDMIAASSAKNAWYTGYIVGSLKAGVETVESVEDIIWGTDAELNNTLVIGQTAESHSLEDCMLIQLPQDTPLREYGNLLTHPENYLKQIWLRATPAEVWGMNGFTGNTGAASEFRIEGVTVPGGEGQGIPTGDGSEASPYNPTQVVGLGLDANEPNVWVKGYIVGWVDNSSQNYADEKNTHFTVPATVATNVLIATTPDVTDYTKCVVVNLPNTNDIRKNVNLVDNPGNLGKACAFYGTARKYFNMPGFRDVTKYTLDGAGGEDPNPPTPGEAVTSFNVDFEGLSNISALTGWTTKEVSGNAAWFTSSYSNNYFASCTGYGSNKTPGANGFESWIISPALNVDGMTSKTLSFKSMVGYSGSGTLDVYVLSSADPATATKTKLTANIPAASGTWSDWVESGTISLANFSGVVYIGWVYNAPTSTGYTTYRIDNVVAGDGSTGGGEDPNPPTPGGNSVDFSIFGGKDNGYKDREADGWTAKWCCIAVGGGDNVNSSVYPFLGDASTTAIVIDGSKARQGSLTSPTLTGGISKLTFNYGFAFNESKVAFTVNIKQGGAVVATDTVTLDTIEKNKVYTFTLTCSVKGDFVIEIVNNAYSQSSSNNKDRVAVWNMSWDN